MKLIIQSFIAYIFVTLLASIVFSSCASSSAANASKEEVVIKTETIQCGMCQERIQTELAKESGRKDGL